MEVLTQPPRSAGGTPFVRLAPAVPSLIALSLIICVAVLVGWFTNNLGIAGFGRSEILMQPWTAVGCIGVGLSFFCAASGRSGAARALAVVPLMVATSALLQEWTDTQWLIDQVLSSHSIRHQPRVHPGRPGLMPAISMLLLTLASLATTCRLAAIRNTITGLACLSLSIAIISGTLLPLGVSTLAAETRLALMSVPTSTTLIAISIAVIAQRRHAVWSNNIHCGMRRQTLQWILAPCVMLPVVSALWQLWTYKNGQVTQEMSEIMQAAAQVAISCAIIAWAWIRIGRESTTRWAFSVAIDSAPIAIADINGRIIRWSKGCEQLYGWAAAEARGQIKHRLTGALLPPGPMRPLSPDCPQEAEVTERHRDGTRLRILESRQLVQPRADIDPMIVLSMKDITERQRAEQAMRASEARLAVAADLHELGLFEWTETDDKVRLSAHAERLFGIEPGTFAGGMKEWRDHVRSRFGADILSDDPVASYSCHRRPFRLCSMEGEQPVIVEGSIFFHDRPDAEGLSMVGIIMDATERERRTEMLEAREFELRSILETVPEAMITVDEAGQVRSFSTAAERLFGFAAEEITGRDIRTLLPDYAKAATGSRPALTKQSSPARASPPQTTDGRDRQGNAMPVELVVGETTIGNEHISIAFVRSLREQIATQARLNELHGELLHASRVSAMGEMGAGLAHELNQPLTATANFLGAAHMRLGMGGSADQLRELVDLANQEVLRAGEIIRRMRAFVARGELDIRTLSINNLIADALQLVWSGTRHAGVNLIYQPSGCSTEVAVDKIQIQQVLVNIINNSLETFAHEKTNSPEIIISAIENNDEYVLIRLLDNGPGFPNSIIGRPFDTFMSTRANGLGLGLSICRRIVEAHGGTVTLSNRAEGGAAFEFTLPVYRTHSEIQLKAAG
ncbi:MAG TPA: PAS domain S-box protein [Sphingomonas sp.]|nr:PAS domain S-box protein [Sphingomonas sp.]